MPLMYYHNQIEAQIESFVENFKRNGSVLISNLYTEPYVQQTTTNNATTTSHHHRHHQNLQQHQQHHHHHHNHHHQQQHNNHQRESSYYVAQQWTLSDDTGGAVDYHLRNNIGNYPSSSRNSTCSESYSCEEAGGNSDNDEAMADVGCQLTVRDVASLLHARYAIITGGKTPEGFPIITFPDTGNFYSLSDEEYCKLILYITNVPTLQEADLGFVLVVDRRNDKWSSVKAVLLKISGYFPGMIHVVFVLRPLGFFQKAISEVSNKFFREDFKFKLVICSSVEDIHAHVSPCQLTADLGGSILYNHEEWIQQRMAVEKFTVNLQEISSTLREMTRKLQETEFPNDVQSTISLLEDQGGEYRNLKDDIRSAIMHGETLLSCIRRPMMQINSMKKCPDSLINASTVQRLLLQLGETEKGFDSFWLDHEKRLSQCLELRKFEQTFKELQVILASGLRELSEIPEAGDSVPEVDSLLMALERFRDDIEDDLDKADQLQQEGEKLISSNHYAVDCIAPKCVELERMVADIRQQVAFRIEILKKNRDLQSRIEKANKWCTRGVNLLAGQQIEKCSSPSFAVTALNELESFLESSHEFNLKDPREFHTLFKGAITPESRALVQQVLKRIDDVQMMCEKRRCSLQRMVSRSTLPVQAVIPEPVTSVTGTGNPSSPGKSPDGRRKITRKTKTIPKV